AFVAEDAVAELRLPGVVDPHGRAALPRAGEALDERARGLEEQEEEGGALALDIDEAGRGAAGGAELDGLAVESQPAVALAAVLAVGHEHDVAGLRGSEGGLDGGLGAVGGVAQLRKAGPGVVAAGAVDMPGGLSCRQCGDREDTEDRHTPHHDSSSLI